MKWRLFKGLLVIGLIGNASLISGQSLSFCQKVESLHSVLQKHHISGIKHYDTLTKRIHNLFYQRLAPSGLLITQQQIQEFPPLITPKAIKNKDYCPNLKPVKITFRNNLKWADSIIKELSKQPFDLDGKQKVKTPAEYMSSFATDQDALKDRLIKWYKYSVLKAVVDRLGPNAPASEWQASEKKARYNLQEQFQCYTNELLKDTTYYQQVFLQAWARSYDPHSQYISPRFMQLMKKRLSKKKKSFGFTVDKEQFGEVTISEITPGGPAWETQQLHKGGRVMSIKPVGGKPLELNCMRGFAINRWLRTTTHSKIRLTVRQKDQKQQTITLKKTELENRQNKIKSFVLAGSEDIGYIHIPAFYTQWKTSNPKGSANDVAKELFKLKQEGIKGLILDLRNNRGGSLYEAINLAGIFVDRVPLGVFRTNTGRNILVKDPEMGAAYDGPLIVLVNEASASASEVLAASLKDVNRALIVGRPTFGKGSAQSLKPLNKTDAYAEASSSSGYAKVTGRLLYRIDGSSYQPQGVQPAITLPHLQQGSIEGEAGKSYMLDPGTIHMEVSKPERPSLPVKTLKAKSQQRIEDHRVYQKVDSFNRIFANYSAKDRITLNLSNFQKRYQRYQITDKALLKRTFTDSVPAPFEVKMHSYDESVFMMNDFEKQAHKAFKRAIYYDMMIRESFQIMNDWINKK